MAYRIYVLTSRVTLSFWSSSLIIFIYIYSFIAQCTKLTGLVLEAKKPGELTLRWSLPRFMGDSVHSLYYQIFYSAEGAVKNKVRTMQRDMSTSIHGLQGHLYIQLNSI